MTTTIIEEINEIRDRQPTPANARIVDILEDCAYEFGDGAVAPYLVVRRAFHGGGRISRHSTAELAAKKARRISNPHDGANPGVVPECRFTSLPDANEARRAMDLAC